MADLWHRLHHTPTHTNSCNLHWCWYRSHYEGRWMASYSHTHLYQLHSYPLWILTKTPASDRCHIWSDWRWPVDIHTCSGPLHCDKCPRFGRERRDTRLCLGRSQFPPYLNKMNKEDFCFKENFIQQQNTLQLHNNNFWLWNVKNVTQIWMFCNQNESKQWTILDRTYLSD